MPSLLARFDSQKVLYPKGLLSKIKESKEDSVQAKRVELFSRDTNESVGILRKFFVAYSSEEKLLQLATVSNGVVQIRALPDRKKQNGQAAILDSRLILRKSPIGAEKTDKDPEISPYTFPTPRLMVPARWKDQMMLSDDDRILVSNPVESYAVPPPNV